MNNLETQSTLGTRQERRKTKENQNQEWTIQRYNQHWAQDKNEEKLKKNKIKNEQSRHNQHWAQDKDEDKLKKNKIKNEQSRDTINIGHKKRTKKN